MKSETMNITKRNILILSLFTGLISPLTIPSANASSPTETLPAHTVVLLSLDEDLRSGQQPAGTAITYRVDKDISSSDGKVLIAAGAHGYGTVIASSGVQGFGKNGKLEISCEYVTAVDGSKIPFDDPDFKNSGGGTRVRALIRPLLLMPFSKGGDVKLEKGLPLTMATASDCPIQPTSLQPNTQDVQVLPNGHNQKTFSARIKSFTADDVVFSTQSGDTDMKLSDINKILQGNDPTQ